MALRGNLSQSFLRSKDLLSFSEISHDKEGNNVLKSKVLEEALARDNDGKLIRNKVNIAKILNKYGVLYRMVFNAMNMDQYTYDEIQNALDHLSEYINDFGVSGIVEFHAADKTQNSDHIHFWISSEDKIIYNKIAQEMVAMGYSNEEDIYIQKYENNEKLDEIEYVHSEDTTLRERFSIKPMGMEAGETLDSINEMLSIDYNKQEVETLKRDDVLEKEVLHKSEPTPRILSSLHEKYNSILDNISNLFKKVVAVKKTIQNENEVDVSVVQKMEKSNDSEEKLFGNKFRDKATKSFDEHLEFFKKKSSITEDCTLPKTNETNSILSRIEELREEMNRK
jgi:hypothetical protein